MTLDALAQVVLERLSTSVKSGTVRTVAKTVLLEEFGVAPAPQQVKSLVSAVKRILDDQPIPTSVVHYGTGGGRRVIRDARGL